MTNRAINFRFPGPLVRHDVSVTHQWHVYKYSGTWELGTLKRLWKTVLNLEVALFLRSISVYWIGLGTGVAVLNSQVVPISQVVLKTGSTVCICRSRCDQSALYIVAVCASVKCNIFDIEKWQCLPTLQGWYNIEFGFECAHFFLPSLTCSLKWTLLPPSRRLCFCFG